MKLKIMTKFLDFLRLTQANFSHPDDVSFEPHAFLAGPAGQALVSHVTHNEIKVPDIIVSGCLSFNYSPSLQRCQLNNATAGDFPLDLNSSTFYDYYESPSLRGYITP